MFSFTLNKSKQYSKFRLIKLYSNSNTTKNILHTVLQNWGTRPYKRVPRLVVVIDFRWKRRVSPECYRERRVKIVSFNVRVILTRYWHYFPYKRDLGLYRHNYKIRNHNALLIRSTSASFAFFDIVYLNDLHLTTFQNNRTSVKIKFESHTDSHTLRSMCQNSTIIK